ncbi:MAG: zf-TFIIB domain-containing protein [Thermodesulfobacteriota bacterium]
MKCPNCIEELKMAERKGIEIDYCPSCRGVWLDRGELDKIIERSAEDLSEMPRGGRVQDPPPATGDKHGQKHRDPYRSGHR